MERGKSFFLSTHILQYRAARARQDSLADNPKNSMIGLFGERLRRPLVSAWIGQLRWLRLRREEADSTLLWNGSKSSNSSYFFF